VADDEDAHWLLGEVPDAAPETGSESAERTAGPRDDLTTARQRRLSAVPPDELPLGEDAIELVSEPHRSDDDNAALGAEQPVEAYLDDASAQPVLPTLDDDSEEDDSDEDPDEGDPAGVDGPDVTDDDRPRHEPPSRKPVKKTRGRASVPSWDEIMFGGGAEE
jgi:hypothetical protein